MAKRDALAAEYADKVRRARPGTVFVYPKVAKYEMMLASERGAVLLFKRPTDRFIAGVREFENCILKLSPRAAKFISAVSASVPAPPRTRGEAE